MAQQTISFGRRSVGSVSLPDTILSHGIAFSIDARNGLVLELIVGWLKGFAQFSGASHMLRPMGSSRDAYAQVNFRRASQHLFHVD